MNWKLTAGLIGAYLGISWLRKRGAVTINKDDPAGKVIDDAANTGDKIADVASQVKAAVAAKIDNTGKPVPESSELDADALATIF